VKHLAALLLVASFSMPLCASEIVKIKLFDDEMLTGKLDLPSDSATIKRLVIYIHGTGPGTYADHRKIRGAEFNYFDLFADEFTKRGTAFFAYSKRGVDFGDTPPYYDKVDREKYKKCLPSIEARDIDAIIRFLKSDKRLRKAKVILLGWSEGTIVASMVAEKNTGVDALFLAGYANDNLFDVIKWQNSGESSMRAIGKYFDANNDGAISKEEYESSDKIPAKMRTALFKDAPFEQLDANKDNRITAEDFGILNRLRYNMILTAVEKQDDDWIWNNYFRITTAWLKEHFELEPNKTRLLRINIPVFIFHGEEDINVPVEGVYDLRERFARNHKTNLQTFIFKGHDHDLNYLDWPTKKVIPEGIKKIFEVSDSM
jgi:pimeloyl-ACP methyl ester carboxylesterase